MVVAALYFGRDLLEPMVLAVLLAFVLAPLVSMLQRARLGTTLPVFIAVLLAFAVIGSIGMVVGRQVSALADGIPAYQATIQHKLQNLDLGPALTHEVQGSLGSLLGSAKTAAAPAQGRGTTTTKVAVASTATSAFDSPSDPGDRENRGALTARLAWRPSAWC